jgi:hypothetical protein
MLDCRQQATRRKGNNVSTRIAPAELLDMLPTDAARAAMSELYAANWELERAVLGDSYGDIVADTIRIESARARLNAATRALHAATPVTN